MTTLPDGTVCIGNDCLVVKVPPKGKGNVTVDLGECPDDFKRAVVEKIGIEGASADFKVTKDEKK